MKMVEFAYAVPGASYRELLLQVETGRQRTEMIRDYLVDVGFLIEEHVLGARRIFPARIHDATARKQITALRDPAAAHLHLILSRASWRQRDLFRFLESEGMKREKVRRVLAKLQSASLAERQGGTPRYPAWNAVTLHPLVNKELRYVRGNC